MSPDLRKQLPQSLHSLLLGLRLYPAEHPQISQQLRSSLETLQSLLKWNDRLTLGLLDGCLLVNEIPCTEQTAAVQEIARLLEKQQLKALEIMPGIDSRQLLIFCQHFPRLQNDDFQQRLENLGIHDIRAIQPDEMDNAAVTYQQALQTVESLCNDVRVGRTPSAEDAIKSTKAMVVNILEQPYTLLALAMLKNYDDYTFNHSVNVAVIAMSVGKACGLPQDQLFKLGLGGLFHDLGKMTITPQIVNKPGKLSPNEYATIQQHPGNGADLVSKMKEIPAEVVDIVRHHHLGFDRTGYPPSGRYLHISPLTEMTCIADSYDAMTSIRCYQPPCSPRQAIDNMKKRRGSYLHPEFLDKFIDYLGPYPVGTLVRLKAGSIGLICDQNRDHQGSLSLKLVIDYKGHKQPEPTLLELADSSKIVAEVDPILNGITLNDYLP
ncbi:metal dependent phosphohydrolase [Malonomonas rubra DSM 5091]|uniref:Metal dependent phosphohydrolase n=1 Tax=Malonomonas rubra DSM 5091 TaxID=1122189 RepID=A0A1M6I963_MALRU|nr:HD domain-containing phosphohydrolase [Malonomonas rubra]SHJ30972.1 metal dependent phosphohydrolase [Malonomonas rubra DSM 5091]